MAISPTEIRKWSIYRITSPSGRIYIGLTSNMVKRMSVYKYMHNAVIRQTLIYNSIVKYGWENHKVDVIDKFKSNVGYANGKEMFWIKTYMSNKNKYPEHNGLNLNDGGGTGIGYKHTQEAIEKNRQSKIGKKASEETKEKMRKIMTGRKMNFTHLTPEFRKMVSERNTGYKHTDEAKKKIGEASKGNKHRLGTKMTVEQIEHRSSLLRGKKKSPENLKKHIQMCINTFGKAVIQYDLYGNFIKEYPMVTIAAKETGIPKVSLDRHLAGKTKHLRGFIFIKKENIGRRIFKFKRRIFRQINIYQIINKAI